jgi:uncharacterized protein YutE (UPF0331/DUF86 family)
MNKTSEREILNQVLNNLTAEGWNVFAEPGRELLPDFFRKIRPDAIAFRGDEKLAIEVVGRSRESLNRVEQMRAALEENGWNLKVVALSQDVRTEELPVASRHSIELHILEVKNLTEGKHFAAALVLSFASLEALTRRITKDARRPQSPGRVIEVLARDGNLVMREVDQLRRLMQKRNRIVHGDLSTEVSAADIATLVSILERLLRNSS